MATIFLNGLVENGTNTNEALAPFDSYMPLRVTQGTSLKIVLTVMYPDGLRVDLSQGSPLLTFTVKQNSLDWMPQVTATGTVTDAAQGIAEFNITPDAFKQFQPGRFVYDIWLVQAGERNPVVPTSPFALLPTVMQAPY